MINVPTTLVLGAGASKPYGFLSGYELRQFICDAKNINGLHKCGFRDQDVAVFSETFLKSEMPSIDAFLARRGKDRISPGVSYADIGKAAIAYSLIRCERPESLHTFSDDHWYQYLWSFLADSLDSFGENKLHIVTFNYDRSLEYYLLTALQHSFGLSPQEAAQHLQKIPILHVYGQLAALPELSVGGMDTRFYSPVVSDPAYIGVAAKSIRVIDESRDDDEVFNTAYSYLSDAERICFIGFGFDQTNMRRLRIEERIRQIRSTDAKEPLIFATTLGLGVAERQRIINALQTSRFPGISESVRMNIESHKALKAEQYLRATGVFIS